MMRSIIFVIVTSALATAAAASLPALTATKEADEKKSPRRLGQTHAEPPISPTSPAEESDEETSSRRLGMTQVETAATPETVTYIIKFEDTAASPGDRCEALALANGGVVGHVYNEVVNGCSLTMPLAEVGVQSGDVIALGDYPKVASIEKDRKVWAFEDGEDNIFDSSSQLQTREVVSAVYWNLDREDQCKLPLNGQATRKSATGTKVYVLDTGIQANHEEFKGLIDPNDPCHHNVVEARALTDNNGHGTHVAATICGNKSGIATGCTLCSVKVLDVNGSGSVTGIIAGIDHAVKDCKKTSGYRCVINMSLGMRANSPMITNAVANAVRANIAVVVAAGNSKDDACKWSPAGVPTAITVGSTTKTDARSSFSNKGLCVDVYAPGTAIRSATRCSNSSPSYTCKAYTTMDGTSMSSPYVAGVAAIIRSRNKNFTPSQVADEIKKKAFVTNTFLKIATGRDCRT